MKNLKKWELISVAAGTALDAWAAPQNDGPFRDHRAGIDSSKNRQLATIVSSSQNKHADEPDWNTRVDIDVRTGSATATVEYKYEW